MDSYCDACGLVFSESELCHVGMELLCDVCLHEFVEEEDYGTPPEWDDC